MYWPPMEDPTPAELILFRSNVMFTVWPSCPTTALPATPLPKDAKETLTPLSPLSPALLDIGP